MPTGNVQFAHPIANHPWVIYTEDNSVHTYLTGLAEVDFQLIADTAAEWAVVASDAGEGTAEGSTGSPGTTFIVSAESYLRVKAHRY